MGTWDGFLTKDLSILDVPMKNVLLIDVNGFVESSY